jgi:hypothetical protein
MKGIKFVTDTATLAVFDPQALAHRVKERVDWWAMPKAELEEINAGNVYLVDLGRNGKYTANLRDEGQKGKNAVCALIKCISGRLRIGPGEELPGGGEMVVEFEGGGYTMDLEEGTYRVCAWREKGTRLALSITPVDGGARNELTMPLQLS